MSPHSATDPLETYLAHDRTVKSPVPSDPDPVSPFPGAAARIHSRIAERIDGLTPQLRQLATELYEDPEIGFAEHRSAERIASLVEANGVRVERGAFGLPTAFRATVGAGQGPHFAIIAEYDALPEIGHACGHNIIAGTAVGAFLAASEHVSELGGRLSLIGTPAEENGGAKELIIQAGGFDDVDAAGMVHPSAGDEVSPIFGPGTSGVRRVRVTYHGRASHAALSPYLGLNALDAVVTAYQSVAQLRQHILPIDRVHGIITDGGSVPNVVPERASALFFVRSDEVDTLRVLTDRVIDALEGAALATGTRAEIDVDFVPPYLPLAQNTSLVKHWSRRLEARGRTVPTVPAVARSGGPSTDMGNVSQFIPSIHPSLGLGGAANVLPHNAGFADITVLDPAISALADGAVALAGIAADYLADPGLRAAAAAEFAASGGRRRWVADGDRAVGK